MGVQGTEVAAFHLVADTGGNLHWETRAGCWGLVDTGDSLRSEMQACYWDLEDKGDNQQETRGGCHFDLGNTGVVRWDVVPDQATCGHQQGT